MPERLQLGVRALYNTIIELGSNTSITQRGEDIIPILVKVVSIIITNILVVCYLLSVGSFVIVDVSFLLVSY